MRRSMAALHQTGDDGARPARELLEELIDDMNAEERKQLQGAIEGGFSPQFMEKVIRAKLGMCSGKAKPRHVIKLRAFLSRVGEIAKEERERDIQGDEREHFVNELVDLLGNSFRPCLIPHPFPSVHSRIHIV